MKKLLWDTNLGYKSTLVKFLGIDYCICPSGNLVFLDVRNILSEFQCMVNFSH